MSADATFNPGYKFNGACFKNCKNRGKKCEKCFRFDEYKEDVDEPKD